MYRAAIVAAARDRTFTFGIRLHGIGRETSDEAGKAAEELIQLPPRDTAASEKKAAKAREDVAKARLLRLRARDRKLSE